MKLKNINVSPSLLLTHSPMQAYALLCSSVRRKVDLFCVRKWANNMTRLLNNGGSIRINIIKTMSPYRITLYQSKINKIWS